MHDKQVRILDLEVFQTLCACDFSVSRTSERLGVSQPTVSRAIGKLEQHYRHPLLRRQGRVLAGLTPAGEQVLQEYGRALTHWQSAEQLVAVARDEQARRLRIATTHTLARYALPPVVDAFRKRWAQVSISIQQGTPAQISTMLRQHDTDLALMGEGIAHEDALVSLPAYLWRRAIFLPSEHALAQYSHVSLRALHGQPLVTYGFSMMPGGAMAHAFAALDIAPVLSVAATDAEVIKTYVRLGMGIGIAAQMAYDPVHDADLVCIDCPEMPDDTVYLAFDPHIGLQKHTLDFIATYCPALTPARLARAKHEPRAVAEELRAQLQVATPAHS